MTTTMRVLAYPALANGISLTASATAWTWPASYTQIVPVDTITSTFYIVGATFSLAANPTVDIRLAMNLSLGKGAAASETEIVQFSAAYFHDSNGHSGVDNFFMDLPEPVEVAANTRIAGRVAHSEAIARVYSHVKIMYEIV